MPRFVSVLVAALVLWISLVPGSAAQNGAMLNNYEGADIRDFIRTISAQTGYSFVLDPRISNNQVTIIAPPDARLTSREVWELFLATMQINNFAVLPITDGEYKIIPTDTATRQPNVNARTAAGGEFITRIVRLNLVDARTAATNLKGLVGERGVVTPIVESNSLIIVDTAANVRRLVEVVGRIDADDSVVRSIQLTNAVAGEVASVLREVSAKGGGGDATRGNGLTIVAMEASNSLVLRGAPADVERLIPVISELDAAGTSQVDLTVIKLNHANAEEIVSVLTEMIEKSYATDTSNRKPSIVFHEQTNALIVNADAETQRIIGSVVRQLDVRRPQVLIEAIIVNVSDNVARDLGLQYVIAGQDLPVISQNFNNTQPNLLAGIGAAYLYDNRNSQTTTDSDNNTTTTTSEFIPGTDTLIDAAIGSLLGVNGFNIGGAVSRDDKLFAAILTAIEGDTESNILSTPFTVTLDNEPARLQVGQEIPITTGEQVGSDLQNTFRTVERQEVGIILEVTPQISDGDTVRLKIVQEVSSINGALTTINSEFVTNKAGLETTALADNGEILILGGLIDDNRQTTKTKVPLLGDIPLAGNLFKTSSWTANKSTLMVFIKPTILRDRQTADAITSRKYEYIRQQQLFHSENEKPSIELLVNEYLGVDSSALSVPNGHSQGEY